MIALVASRLVEFTKIFINTLAGMMFAANLVSVPVFVCKMMKVKTERDTDKYFKKAVLHLWCTMIFLAIFYFTRDWGIQIW